MYICITDSVDFDSKYSSLVFYTYHHVFVIDYFLHNLQKLATISSCRLCPYFGVLLIMWQVISKTSFGKFMFSSE